MAYPTPTVTTKLQALVVDIIRRLWDHGLHQNNKWLRQIHDTWLGHWIDVKAANTMRSVDKQAKALTPEPEIAKPIYWEEEDGDTPLGGALGYTYRFYEDDDA